MRIGEDSSAYSESFKRVECTNWEYRRVRATHQLPVPDGRTCRKTVTVGRVDQQTHVQVKRGYFRLRTDGRTDRQPKNIMPPAPKGGGIKTDTLCRIQLHLFISVYLVISVPSNELAPYIKRPTNC